MDHSYKSNMTKGQKDCQSQVRELFQRLASWRDESQRQMSNIISSQTKCIDNGFNNLVEEFSDLQNIMCDNCVKNFLPNWGS